MHTAKISKIFTDSIKTFTLLYWFYIMSTCDPKDSKETKRTIFDSLKPLSKLGNQPTNTL